MRGPSPLSMLRRRPLTATLDSVSFGCAGTPFEIEDARLAVIEFLPD